MMHFKDSINYISE